MGSRYERNKKLYEDVKQNNYSNHNEKIIDDFDFDGSGSRENYREKKRLSTYFKDIDDELSEVNNRLEGVIANESGLKIKDNVNLETLITQAKKKQSEEGGPIFSNTQHEILSNLSLDEEEVFSLEDIVGETFENNLDNVGNIELSTEEDFENTMVADISEMDLLLEQAKEENIKITPEKEFENTMVADISEMDLLLEQAKEENVVLQNDLNDDSLVEVQSVIGSDIAQEVEDNKEVIEIDDGMQTIDFDKFFVEELSTLDTKDEKVESDQIEVIEYGFEEGTSVYEKPIQSTDVVIDKIDAEESPVVETKVVEEINKKSAKPIIETMFMYFLIIAIIFAISYIVYSWFLK